MNVQALINKIDAYFDRVSPEEIVSIFEKKGYVFEDIFDPKAPDIPFPRHRKYNIGTNDSYIVLNKKQGLTPCFFYFNLVSL